MCPLALSSSTPVTVMVWQQFKFVLAAYVIVTHLLLSQFVGQKTGWDGIIHRYTPHLLFKLTNSVTGAI